MPTHTTQIHGRHAVITLLVALLALLTAACGGGNTGFPRSPGQYAIQPGSITYDGDRYSLLWVDVDGSVHPAEGRDVRMQRDERTFLEIGNGSPVIHLAEEEAVVVRGRDRDGEFETLWFPFFLGRTLGGGPVIINQPYPGDAPARGPTYQYPPTDTFGRDDELHGSIQRSKPEAPDYSKVPPAPYAVSGQAAGTGAGTAASNKPVGPTSGQSGGTGSGTAASSKSSTGGPASGQAGAVGSGSAATTKGTFSAKPKTGAGGTGVRGGSGWLSGSGGSGISTSKPPSSPRGSAPGRSLGGRRR